MLAFAATRYQADKASTKAATERLIYNCVSRLGKEQGRVMYGTIPSIAV